MSLPATFSPVQIPKTVGYSYKGAVARVHGFLFSICQLANVLRGMNSGVCVFFQTTANIYKWMPTSFKKVTRELNPKLAGI